MSAIRMIAYGVLVPAEMKVGDYMDIVESVKLELRDLNFILKTWDGVYSLYKRTIKGHPQKSGGWKRRHRHMITTGNLTLLCKVAVEHVDNWDKLNKVVHM